MIEFFLLMQDFVIYISTVNGTGSQSANQLLSKIFFRHGFSVGNFNFFPSNIAGLPCMQSLRINTKGYTAWKPAADLLVSFNPKTRDEDIKHLKPSGCLITDKKEAFSPASFNGHHKILPISESLTKLKGCPLKARKVLRNIVYVGLISRWMDLDEKICRNTLSDFFFSLGKSKALLESNREVFQEGWKMAETSPLDLQFEKPTLPDSFSSREKENALSSSAEKLSLPSGRIFIDGNSAAALGALSAGCQLVSWYPITPATSLVESFSKYAVLYKKQAFSVVQAEDEIAAFSQVMGAGWAGLRAMTVTSGPGLSLMAEGAGLAYFAEVPALICNVQRAGPSTGLPTRTAQGDLLSACFLSHGDTRHIVLLPGSVEECFLFAREAFRLAELLQTLIIFLSDLDLAMNFESSPPFTYTPGPLQRGKILDQKDLDKGDFLRYRTSDPDAVSGRVLPGTAHPKAGYLTRGSGHDSAANYSESPEDYQDILNKLKTKWREAKKLMPKPVIVREENTSQTLVTFGKNESAVKEAIDILKEDDLTFNYLRLRSYPLHPEAEEFLKEQEEIYVVEQNRDGQLKRLLKGEYPDLNARFQSVLKYRGQPFSSEEIVAQIKKTHPK